MIQNPCMTMMGIHQHGDRHHEDHTSKHVKRHGDEEDHKKWMIMEADHDDDGRTYNMPSCSSSSSSSFLDDSSSISNGSTSSSSELVDDASSSSSNNGPLYELSELISNLPIKRGLSKYFDGKSQSYTSLTSVRSIEDLAKKENPFRRKRMKIRNKSFGGGLESKKSSYTTLPKPTISKKNSRSCLGNNRIHSHAMKKF